MRQLDSDLLRTFLAVVEAGSVTEGAVRIHRSQSATSTQLRQLEEVVGKPLLRRHARGVAATPAGEQLLPVARRVTATLDAALNELRHEGLAGRLRIGLPDTHGREALARVVSAFTLAHPGVELEVQCALGEHFGRALRNGRLDMAVHELAEVPASAECLRSDRLLWLGSRRHDVMEHEPLPVALFDQACWWREAALEDLEAAGISYRVAFTSESVLGVQAAVESGIAVALLSERDIGEAVAPLPDFARKRASHLVLETASGMAGPIVKAMQHAIRRAFTGMSVAGRGG